MAAIEICVIFSSLENNKAKGFGLSIFISNCI